MIRPVAILRALACSLLVAVAGAADFYVSASGSDSNAGTSAGTAWKTIAPVNARVFSSGDRIRFQGGQTFSGRLYFDAADAGTATNPITITSFGTGRATIDGGNGMAFYGYN
nr:hypothetical protein [Planctomycetota bacterium]